MPRRTVLAARADRPRPTIRRLLERTMTPTPAEPTTSIRRRAASLGRYRRWPVPAERGGRASKRWQQWSLPSPLGSDVRALSGRRVVGPDSLADASHGALNLVTNSFQHSGVLCVGRNVEGDRPPMRGRQPPDRSPCARAPGSRSLHLPRRVDHPPDVLTPGWFVVDQLRFCYREDLDCPRGPHQAPELGHVRAVGQVRLQLP